MRLLSISQLSREWECVRVLVHEIRATNMTQVEKSESWITMRVYNDPSKHVPLARLEIFYPH